jgi:hypothetical protein
MLRAALGVLLALAPAAAGRAEERGGPAHVSVESRDGAHRLLVDGEPFRIRGAGLEHGDQEALAAAGGNAFRTWRTVDGRAVLDRAQANRLRVAMGIEVVPERRGFDYDDARAVARQRERIRAEVLALKDHPALLLWIVGNELNLEARNPRVWDAVGEIAAMIHALDPHHPVMTTLAGFDAALLGEVTQRAPQLDLLGFQLYGDLASLPARLRRSGWSGAYVVTEWGPTGHWESPRTPWGAPLEDHSTRKAELLLQRYRDYADADQRQGLGSFVFLWGQKQERTPTWYGLFLESGEPTASVDAMQRAWTGAWPANRSPAVGAIELDGRTAEQGIELVRGRRYEARIEARDPEGDKLEYRWSVRPESQATSVGGDREAAPRPLRLRFTEHGPGAVRFVAPRRAGAYRLFVTVHDRHGRAGYANAPFLVAPPPD